MEENNQPICPGDSLNEGRALSCILLDSLNNERIHPIGLLKRYNEFLVPLLIQQRGLVFIKVTSVSHERQS